MPIQYGRWTGREGQAAGQDMVVVKRALRTART